MTAVPEDLEPAPTSLAERAYAAIRDRLVMLDIAPMAAIDEAALAEAIGVGRTPVREALKRLETERLVVSYPRRGTFATSVDLTELAYVSEIRVRLEPWAARRAAEHAGEAARAQIGELADALATTEAHRLSRHELMRWDLRVHRALYRAAGNPHLEDTLVRYHNLATRIFCLFVDRLAHFDRHVGEHVHLLRAVADRDPSGAEQAARDHVTHFEKAIRAVI
ncbi:GntR family transcriptional regulator [Amycolatopsis sp. A1MSW2902]|uniref:GntR family transcriptional regulator n=1 Tax=Amycolatopsis sp. A1MSW2902 TaxID=687413 RepID=UPI00307F19CB